MFEAHSDYIRCIAVHGSQPLLLSSSDDMTIRLWDWDKQWMNTMTFEGHSHYVMQVVFNPKDPNTFASASLDRTIKVWGLSSPVPHFTLEGHEKGVNCIDYFSGGDKPYLVSGADDKTVKVWDYQARTCVQTLGDHSHNVSALAPLGGKVTKSRCSDFSECACGAQCWRRARARLLRRSCVRAALGA